MGTNIDGAGDARLWTEQAPDRGVSFTWERSFLSDFRRRSFTGADRSEVFHHNTKVTDKYARRREITEREIADLGVRDALTDPPPKRTNSERISLHAEPCIETSEGDADDQSATSPEPLDEERLSALLRRACSPGSDGDVPYHTAGGIRSVETYVVSFGDPLPEGVYYYVTDEHELAVLDRTRTDVTAVGEALPGDEYCGIVCCFTGSFWRTKCRYGDRGYRYALQEAGAVSQSVRTASSSLGLDERTVYEFDDRKMDSGLGVDGVNESSLVATAVRGR